MNNRDIAFTHRPIAGASVGAYSDGSILYVAAAFTNDGTSRNGIFHANRLDTFSRATSRAIIKGRIKDADANGTPENGFVLSFVTDMTGPEFIRELRQEFKPNVFEEDDVLHNTFEGFRARMTANNMWEVILNISNEVALQAA